MPKYEEGEVFCVEVRGKIVCPDCFNEIDAEDITPETIKTLEDAQSDSNVYFCDYCKKMLKK